MARTGWSTANYLRYAAGVLTAQPLSMSAWGWTSIMGSFQGMVGLFNSGSSANRNSILLGVDSTNKISAQVNGTGGQGVALSSTTIAANSWFHAAGVFNSSILRAAFLNGGGKITNTTSETPSGINRTGIGAGISNDAGNSAFAPAGTGYIAEAGIWNIALSDADVLALSKGLSPLMVHPEALVAYWPLIGRYSPEINFMSNAAVLSVQGTLGQAAHTRIIMPPRRKLAA